MLLTTPSLHARAKGPGHRSINMPRNIAKRPFCDPDQRHAESTIPCCVSFFVPVDLGVDRKYIHGEKDFIEIRLSITGGKSCDRDNMALMGRQSWYQEIEQRPVLPSSGNIPASLIFPTIGQLVASNPWKNDREIYQNYHKGKTPDSGPPIYQDYMGTNGGQRPKRAGSKEFPRLHWPLDALCRPFA